MRGGVGDLYTNKIAPSKRTDLAKLHIKLNESFICAKKEVKSKKIFLGNSGK